MSDSGQEPSLGRLLVALEALIELDAVNLQAALTAACNIVAETLAADKVDAFLIDPATESLVAWGTSLTPMGERQHAIGLNRLPVANGGREVDVYQTGEPYWTGRADMDPGQLRGVVEGLGVRSVAAAPLVVANERRGVFLACSAQPERFTDADLAFVVAASRWVGAIAHRAELTEHIAAEAREQGRRIAAAELIATLAHDLGNLLTPMKARIGLLRRRARRNQQDEDLRDLAELDRSLERLRRLTGDLLDAGRLDHGLFALDLGPVDLGILAQETAAGFTSEATPIAVEAEDGVVALADADRLRQALENVVANAIKHSPGDTPVVVTVRKAPPDAPERASIVVADQGPGVPVDLLPRLFERFARGTDSTGLGLGLHLAAKIAEAHGGSIAVDPAAGAGARFILSVPLDGPAS